ncbi:RecQ family ATP-dependent DNA helicase [Persicimonas caeni]|nr:ATP-dependent DNA helicase RecQ [Persicimonas caeni]
MTLDATQEILRPLGPTALAPFAETADDALRQIFGYDAFRPGQREVVEHLLEGRDALVVMPTGSGKSLCYQLAGAVTQGVTLVVSPLIALMKDQVDALASTGLPACAINSSISRAQQQERIAEMYAGDYKLVYVAPERFRSPSFCEALEEIEIGLLAIDEAHCISQWGHDFRPDYRRLAEVRRRFGSPQTVALTATATEFVQRDILEQLDIDGADMLVSGFERPNLRFEVFKGKKKRDKMRHLRTLIGEHTGESVIVYVASRKQVNAVGKMLEDEGVSVGRYHGGMSAKKRTEAQERWMDGGVEVMVATNAFGMGVDKPDVRAVIHYNAPGSIEAYYQEAGRAGRDGKPARCVLMYRRSDMRIHEWFADNAYPLRMQLIRVWLHLRSLGPGEHKTTPAKLAKGARGRGQKLPPMVVGACLDLLSRAGHIRRKRGSVEVIKDAEPLELDVDFDRLEDRRHLAKEQIRNVSDYAGARDCYQASLLAHFGSAPSFGEECGHCGLCDPR